MSEVQVTYLQWEQSLAGLGWKSPYPETLWGQLGGGEAQMVSPAKVAELVSAQGWTAQHADSIWAAVQSPQPTAQASVQPAVPLAQMPWESASVPEQISEIPTKPADEKKPSKRMPSLSPLFLRRLGASLIDALVFAAALLLVCKLGKIPLKLALGGQPPGSLSMQMLLCFVTVSAIMVLYFSWSMRRSAHQGQSIGKQLMKLRLLSQSGQQLATSKLLLRQGILIVAAPWLMAWVLNQLLWPAGFVAAAFLLLASCAGYSLADRIIPASTKAA